MESRILVLLLTVGAALTVLTGCSSVPVAQQDEEQPAVVEPEVERRDITVADIDTENFEVGAFVGQMSIEDFGVSTVSGARSKALRSVRMVIMV